MILRKSDEAMASSAYVVVTAMPGRVNLWVSSTSVQVVLKPKICMKYMDIALLMIIQVYLK